MMGGGAFILLKGGHLGPKSAKQAENRLAALLKILRIARSPSAPAGGKMTCRIAFAAISLRYG
jgi:hypothetical protein